MARTFEEKGRKRKMGRTRGRAESGGCERPTGFRARRARAYLFQSLDNVEGPGPRRGEAQHDAAHLLDRHMTSPRRRGRDEEISDRLNPQPRSRWTPGPGCWRRSVGRRSRRDRRVRCARNLGGNGASVCPRGTDSESRILPRPGLRKHFSVDFCRLLINLRGKHPRRLGLITLTRDTNCLYERDCNPDNPILTRPMPRVRKAPCCSPNLHRHLRGPGGARSL